MARTNEELVRDEADLKLKWLTVRDSLVRAVGGEEKLDPSKIKLPVTFNVYYIIATGQVIVVSQGTIKTTPRERRKYLEGDNPKWKIEPFEIADAALAEATIRREIKVINLMDGSRYIQELIQ